MANDIVELMETGAGLLDSLENAYGLRAGFHGSVTPGLRILVRHCKPVTPEVGVLDQVALAIGAEIKYFSSANLWSYEANGAWRDTAVCASHSIHDPEADPCVLTSRQTAAVVRDMLPLIRQLDQPLIESVHAYDKKGEPRGHLVLRSENHKETLRGLGSLGLLLENPPGVFSAYSTYGTVLLPSGTPVTVASS